MELVFSGEIVHWRGPAPYLFVVVPEQEAAQIASVAPVVTYGWGMIPVAVTIGATRVTTSLWPRHGSYVAPIKKVLQEGEGVGLGDVVTVRLDVDA
ncbi:MAG TPA: DUF1905 domain-containing protein [Micrococcales bacterium]|uniref:DUF1905 domain-containing protein n=1 Tax=Miniimonas arenae TaxID=676201 RepID=UPI000EC5C91F|nr:DUF1905 domain-containing protein [Miniimonas arenae]HCX85943.1 DUF1905 domain-containing protein [Micrococcales bacterium]